MSNKNQSNKGGRENEGNRGKNQHSATKSGQSKGGGHSSSQSKNEGRDKVM